MVAKYIIDRVDIYDLLTGKELSLSQPSRARAFSVKIAGKMTNGDMIKAIFPDVEIEERKTAVYMKDTDGVISSFGDTDWWNAPYRGGKEDEISN